MSGENEVEVADAAVAGSTDPKVEIVLREHATLTEALAAAVQEIPQIPKRHTAKVRSPKGDFSYTYADLSDVLTAISGPLSRNGLAVVQQIEREESEWFLVTRLRHRSESIESRYPIPHPADVGPQQFGSALTYARRYSVCALVGVSAGDDDDARTAEVGRDEAPPQRRESREATPARPSPLPNSGQLPGCVTLEDARDLTQLAKDRIKALIAAGNDTLDPVEGYQAVLKTVLHKSAKNRLRELARSGERVYAAIIRGWHPPKFGAPDPVVDHSYNQDIPEHAESDPIGDARTTWPPTPGSAPARPIPQGHGPCVECGGQIGEDDPKYRAGDGFRCDPCQAERAFGANHGEQGRAE